MLGPEMKARRLALGLTAKEFHIAIQGILQREAVKDSSARTIVSSWERGILPIPGHVALAVERLEEQHRHAPDGVLDPVSKVLMQHGSARVAIAALLADMERMRERERVYKELLGHP
jgi:hypothetical protein